MDGVTQSREIRPSPPVAFPVYGLDPSWSGSRWLDGFGDRIGDEVRWMRLAHQGMGTGALIMVETHSRPLTDSQAARSGEPSPQSAIRDPARCSIRRNPIAFPRFALIVPSVTVFK
jgi:hypothetical protein